MLPLLTHKYKNTTPQGWVALKNYKSLESTWESMKLSVVLKLNISSSSLPHPAPLHDSEYFIPTLEVYLTILYGRILCFSDFLGGTGRDRRDRRDRRDGKD